MDRFVPCLRRPAARIAGVVLAGLFLLAVFPGIARCATTIAVDPAAMLGSFAPELLGVNVQWTSGCDGLQEPGGGGLSPSVLARVKELAPPLVRYPGGLLSSTQDWRLGVGPLEARGYSPDFVGKKEKMTCGTGEFLDFLKRIQARGMITANVTRTPEEAAQWLEYVKKAGGDVPWWEIGNESYFPQDPSYMSARDYGDRFGRFSRVLRRVDPGVRVGAILEGSLIAAAWAKYIIPDIKGWNADVVAATAAEADFYTVHLYAPFNHDRAPEGTVRAIMAAPAALEKNLAEVLAMVRKAKPDAAVFVTEFNVGTDNTVDNWGFGVTLAQAGYTAQMLCAYARNGVAGANFWSLVGNHNFGLVKSREDPRLRPAGMLYAALRPLAGAKVLRTVVEGPAFDYPEVGNVPANMALSVVAAQAFDTAGSCMVVAVNRDPRQPQQVSLRLSGSPDAAVFTARMLTGAAPLASNEKGQDVTWLPETAPGTVLTMPPGATALLRVVPQ